MFHVLQKYKELTKIIVKSSSLHSRLQLLFVSAIISPHLDLLTGPPVFVNLLNASNRIVCSVFYHTGEESMQFICAASESEFMCMCAGACRDQKSQFRDLPELELQVLVSTLTWVLGTNWSHLWKSSVLS